MISKEIVKIFDGEISFSSQYGKGSCFWFTFKLHDYTQQQGFFDTQLAKNDSFNLSLNENEFSAQVPKSFESIIRDTSLLLKKPNSYDDREMDRLIENQSG